MWYTGASAILLKDRIEVEHIISCHDAHGHVLWQNVHQHPYEEQRLRIGIARNLVQRDINPPMRPCITHPPSLLTREPTFIKRRADGDVCNITTSFLTPARARPAAHSSSSRQPWTPTIQTMGKGTPSGVTTPISDIGFDEPVPLHEPLAAPESVVTKASPTSFEPDWGDDENSPDSEKDDEDVTRTVTPLPADLEETIQSEIKFERERKEMINFRTKWLRMLEGQISAPLKAADSIACPSCKLVVDRGNVLCSLCRQPLRREVKQGAGGPSRSTSIETTAGLSDAEIHQNNKQVEAVRTLIRDCKQQAEDKYKINITYVNRGFRSAIASLRKNDMNSQPSAQKKIIKKFLIVLTAIPSIVPT